MIPKIRRNNEGQALVEFALIIVLLLFVLFLIIESGRMFQGWLTVQNSARAAGRYALTGQFDSSCLAAVPFPCLDPRVSSIKEEAQRAASGLNIDPDVPVGTPKSFVAEVWSPNANGTWVPDYAGAGGSPIRIRVTYEMPLITPLLEALVPSIQLVGQIVVTAENSDQTTDAAFQNTTGGTGGNAGGGGTLPELDLALSKTAPGASRGVPISSPFTYQLVITNYGPFNAEGATIIDRLPPGVIYNSASSPRGSFCNTPSGQDLTCFLAPLTGDGGPLSTDRLTLNVTSPNVVGDITNSATVTPGLTATDSNLGNNSDSVTVRVRVPETDVGVDLRDYYTAVRVRDQVTVTVHVENFGPDLAPNVAVATTVGGDWTGSLTNNQACAVNGAQVTCNIGDMVDGATFDVVLTFYAEDDPGTITVNSQVSGLLSDPNMANNSDSATIQVAAKVADVQITKIASSAPVYVGDVFEYTLQVQTNPSWSGVGQIIVTDTLPSEVSLEDWIVYDASHARRRDVTFSQPSGGVLRWEWPGLLPGEIDQVVVTVRAGTAGVARNTATVSSDTIDNNLLNNTSTASKLIGMGDLVITKTLLTAQPTASVPFTYSIEVHNNGPNPMTFDVVDNLPSGMIPAPGHNSQPASTCQPIGANDRFWCDLSLDPGQSMFFTVPVVANTAGTLNNRASLTADDSTPDGNLANNEFVLPTDVHPLVDIVVGKSAFPNPVTAGDVLTYTIDVVNTGPSASTRITVTDVLTSGLTYLNSRPSGACSVSGQAVTCIVSNLGVDRRRIIQIVAYTHPTLSEGSTISNTVSAITADTELDLSNNSDGELVTVARTLDLRLNKRDARDPTVAGESLTYFIDITNDGPSDATNVAVIDELPPEVVFNPASSDGRCSMLGPDISCDLGGLAQGASDTVNITVDVPSDLPEGYSLANYAVVSSSEVDLNPSDNRDNEWTTVGGEADVRIIKLDSPDPVAAGGLLTYTIGVHNDGPSMAANIVVDDKGLGKRLTNLTYSGQCALQPNSDLTCTIPNLAVGSAVTMTVSGVVPVNTRDGITLSNSATVDADTSDPDSSNNQSSTGTLVERRYDLAITKSGPTSVVAGKTFNYTIVVTNKGPSVASGVVVEDLLPAGLTFLSASIGGCSGTTTIVCNIGTMSPGSRTFTISAGVDPSLDEGTVLSNRASVRSNSSESELDPSNNTSQEVLTLVTTQPNIDVTKTDSQAIVIAGDGVTYAYTILVTSNGTSTAKAVALSDGWPGAFVQGTVTTNTGSCAATGGDFTCSLGDMLPGTSAVVTANYTVPADAPEGDQQNIVIVDYLNALILASNDDVTTIETRADMSVAKSDDQDPIVAGDGLTHRYAITVTNGGPSNADGVVLSDNWPAGFGQGTISSPPGTTCTSTGGNFTCDLGTMVPNSTATVVVDFTVPSDAAIGDYENAASVTSEEIDPDPSNNDTTESTQVIAESDLGINKDDGQSSVVAGAGGYAFSIDVTNAGPSLASGVVITETWPADYAIVSPAPGCSATSGTFTCTLPDIPVGATERLTIGYGVLSDAAPQVTNAVSVGSMTTDPGPDPNTDTDVNDVTRQADLSITKTDGQSTVTAGRSGTFTILVTNNGPSAADGVTVTDQWPTDFNLTGATTSQGAGCGALTGNQFSCELGTLDAGDSAIVTVHYSVDANHTPKAGIANTAAVTSAEPDPNGANNSATDTTSIVTSVDVAVQKTAAPQTVNAGGGPYAYTISVVNNGPSVAHNVIVADTWPASLNLISAVPSQGTCGPLSGDQFSCDLGTLPDGNSATISIQYSVLSNTPSGTITNAVSVTDDDPDRLPGNNNASVVTTVQAAPDLVITKDDGTDTVVLGQTYTYTINVDNIGMADAANVVVRDNWPVSYTLQAASTSVGTGCSAVSPSGVITCNLGSLAAQTGESISLRYQLIVTADDSVRVTNTASASTPTAGDPAGNNTASDENMTQTIFGGLVLAPRARDPQARLAPPWAVSALSETG